MSARRVATGARLRWGQMLAAGGGALGGLQAATQHAAAALAGRLDLGPSLGSVAGVEVFPPWSLFPWWLLHGRAAPAVFDRAGVIAAGGALAGLAAAIVLSLWRAREEGRADTYGSARWAGPSDLRRAGLTGPDGVVVGRVGRRYLRHDGPEHVLCVAPTRSGKGVGVVVPTLLTWPGSVLVHDIKGENWRLTAGWRDRFSRVIRFDPTDPDCDAFNPLMEVRPGLNEVRDVQNIADLLVDPEGALERRSHWEKTSHALLVGVILHVLHAEADKTLAGVAAFLSNPARPVEAGLRAMLATAHTPDGPHPVAAQAARELLDKSENERSGVVSTALSFLQLYRDPLVAAATACSTWRLADLRDGERPASLYLVTPPGDISRTRPLVRLILNQLCRRLTEVLDDAGNERRRLLLMLDEFPALGRLDFFESAMAFMAGYGMKAVLVAQSLNQLDRSYGQNHAILDNCHVRVAFAANDERTARRISESLGGATELRAMKNYAGHRLAPWLEHTTVSRQETARPLLTPGEVMQLDDEEALVLVGGRPPIRAKKARYHRDRRLRARVLPPPSRVQAAAVLSPAWSVVLPSARTTSPQASEPQTSARFGDLDGGIPL